MNRHVRVFRRLLRAYPDGFRVAYGDEMTRLFADQLSDAVASRRPFAVARLWVDSVIDLVVTAPGQHVRKEQPVEQRVDLGSGTPVGGDRIASAEGPKLLLGLLPIWLLGFFQLAAPYFLEPALAGSPVVAGLPIGLTLLGVVVILTAVGVLAMRRAVSTRGVLLAFLLLTCPAVFVLVLTPAAILVLANAAA